MDIRTKLVFTLVAVALGSMLAIGAFTYRSAASLILDIRLNQLDGLAESRQEALEDLFDGWRDRVRLIASRTQLRVSLDEFNRTNDPQAQLLIQRILSDALGSVATVRRLSVYGEDGMLVASVASRGAPDPGNVLTGPRSRSGPPVFRSTSVGPDRTILLQFTAPMVLDDEFVGSLDVAIHPGELEDLVASHRGLGDTGETIVVMDDDGGRPRILHPVRHQPEETDPAALPPDGDALLVQALRGEESFHTDEFRDYRGQPVWAATRFLEEPGWGLVVKLDSEEQMAPIREFRRQTTELGISLAAFAILLGTILGLRFAKPIHDLAEAAEQIREGQLDARVVVGGQDEVGMLARTFNQMAEGLERRVTELHEFKSFFESSLDMLCIANTDGYFKRTNPAFENILGWTEEELLRVPFVEFVHPEDVENTVAEVDQLRTGIPTVSFENRFRRVDGSYTRLHWTSFPDPPTGMLYAIAREIPDPDPVT